MTPHPDDHRHMARALGLARRGLYTARPNPAVGCVLVREGRCIGEGWHRRAGEPHAEINALADARQHGEDTAGATAYVTLEPCAHRGRTGPCSAALAEAGITRVVYGMEDPNPQVAGAGNARLREAGAAAEGPLMEGEARALNPGFIKRMERGLPYVRIKMAMSLDGRTAMASGESKWITGPDARADVQRLRARSGAVISGIETVLRDDPSLNVRIGQLDLPEAETVAANQPLRVILDSRGRLPAGARTVTIPGQVLVVNADSDAPRLHSDTAEVQQLSLGRDGNIDLRRLLALLAERDCNEVLVESGATLAGRFISEGLVDEVNIYMAPKLLGSSARPLFQMPLETMSAQLGLRIADIRAVGQDWRITATVDPEA